MTVATTEPTTAVELAPVAGSAGANLIREAAAVMADAHKLSVAICNTKMVPKHFQGQPDECAAAMLYGASLGFDPMQSIRQIYVVHGQAGLYGRSMVALVMSAGHKVWTVETSDESVTVAAQRKGSQHIEAATWTIERATKAGYVPTIDPETGKYRTNQYGKVVGNEKYFTDPQGMLYAKAASEVCRKIAPDVLNGVYAVEELESDPTLVTVEQVQPSGLRGILQTSGPAPTADAPSLAPVESEVAGPEPAEVEQITPAQLKKLKTLLTNLGMGRDEGLAFYDATIGHPVDSSKDLTKVEASIIIDKLEAAEPVDAQLVEEPTHE